MQLTGVYRFTSIARPVDPAYPTNKAVLILLPIAAILSAVYAIVAGNVAPETAALSGALAAFGGWALTRELAPDDDFAAFLSLGFAVISQAVFGPATVLPLFVALFLVRIVNRTTGCPPRLLDACLVTGFVLWAMPATGDPMLGMVATIAFYLDASLSKPSRLQVVFGTICLGGSMFFVVRDGMQMPAVFAADDLVMWLLLGLLTAYSVVMFALGSLLSVGDIDELPLNVPRVRAGMFTAGLLALAAPVYAGESGPNPILWACFAGVVAGALFGRFSGTTVSPDGAA